MAADFQNVYCYNVCRCSSVVLADVLEHNCNPASENELSLGLRWNPAEVRVTSGQKPSKLTKIIYIVLQTSVGLF